MPLIDDVRTLTPRIRARAPEIESAGAVPDDLIATLAGLGVFRAREPVELLDVVEELGCADGSTGWVAMIAGSTAAALARLAPELSAELSADPRFLIAGVAAPMGVASTVDGGFRVSGRWPFASGCRQATWLIGGVRTDTGVRMAVMRPDELTVHDTWQVMVLAGTGSHDIEADGVFVPAARVFAVADPRTPGLLAFGIAAVALGIARTALEAFGELARSKRNPLTGETIAATGGVRSAYANAEALRASGPAHLRAAVAADTAPAQLRLATAAVDLVYTAAGGSAVYAGSPLQRCLRDVHVATQHAMVNADVVELAGAALLGEPVTPGRL